MTVEALLEKLKNERVSMITSSCVYGSEALQAMKRNDYDAAMTYVDDSNECSKKAQQLDMIIAEIEKRVS